MSTKDYLKTVKLHDPRKTHTIKSVENLISYSSVKYKNGRKERKHCATFQS